MANAEAQIVESSSSSRDVRTFTGLAYAVVLLGSFLLFQVELIIGRLLLPWFGGSPATWITCLLFFQVALLFAYAYAHLINRITPWTQAIVHSSLLAASLLLLIVHGLHWRTPISPLAEWQPTALAHPSARIIELLALAIGIPFFALSATAPLVQAWLARLRPNVSAYPLYAYSNLGSLLGLLSYPLVVEPRFTLATQGWTWSIAFVLFTVLCSASAIIQRSAAAQPSSSPSTTADIPTPVLNRLLWFVLAGCASALLLAVTNMICQEIAGFALLWVLPLAIYLLTFILTFARHSLYRRWLFHPLFGMAFMLVLILLRKPTLWVIPAYLVLLFATCMCCHGELVRLKPPASQLTSFYLIIAAGGAVGSAFVSLAAPALFTELWELPVAELASIAVFLVILFRDRTSWVNSGSTRMFLAIAWGACLYFRTLAFYFKVATPWDKSSLQLLAVFAAATAWLMYRSRSRQYRGRFHPVALFTVILSLLLTYYCVTQTLSYSRGAVYSSRNFFGILHVFRNEHELALLHGHTSHGFQFLDPARRDVPTSYYHANSGVGRLLMEEQLRSPGHLRVGVVGLGVGTLAAYGLPGDYYRFYEINPAVYALSSGPNPKFTFLADSKATTDVQIGDARLLLEAEARHGDVQNFDVLVLDAFNSDSIPVHLLTAEAFDIYLKHIKNPDGVIAVHISNRSLNLAPVLAGISVRYHLASALMDDVTYGQMRSVWVLLSRNPQILKGDRVREIAAYGPPYKWTEYWTDDYSNLLRLVRWPNRPQN